MYDGYPSANSPEVDNPRGTMPDRKSIRLQRYDYSHPGYYFVTVCAFEKQRLFGRYENGRVVLNEWGDIVHDEWTHIPKTWPHIQLDEYIILQDHIHGIIVINSAAAAVGASQRDAPKRDSYLKPQSIGAMLAQFKSRVVKRIRQITPYRHYIWQRGYHDRIIRNDAELIVKREYIRNNVRKH